jgi:phosphopantothenoylcysteine synthetase/decarboxylase
VTTHPTGGRVVTVVVCGAGPASEVGELVKLAQERGWTVGIIATPAALGFLDVAALEELTGSPVRSEYRAPGEARTRILPKASAMVVAPATYNTVCKLALGISDTYALGTLAEAVGCGVPVAVLPFVNTALAARKPFAQAVESLRDEGVRVVFGPGQWVPHSPGTGGERIASFPWAAALDAAGVRAASGEAESNLPR